jgi:membrane-bound metal-dependent hydrolase YbcI (DUF457 family)
MPSPLGHALGGIAAGCLLTGRQLPATTDHVLALALAAAAMVPDLDLLVGTHRGPSHSIGAACLAGVAGLVVTRQLRFALAIAAAWMTHPLLDCLGHDTRPPLGAMALWPFSREYYLLPVQPFGAISRRYWLVDSWFQNARAIAIEVALLGPPAALGWWYRKRSRGRGEEPL